MPFRYYDADKTRQTIAVSDEVVHTMAEGLGFNWFSTYEPIAYPSPDDEVRWQRVFDHASWLNIQFVRFGQSARAMCDERGRFQPGHASFDQLRRLNQWAEARGVNLIVDSWFIPDAFQFRPWEGAPHPWGHEDGYNLGVEDIDGYVNHFVVPYLKHVTEEMGCKAVKWYNHFNEPLAGSHQCATPPGIDDHVRYVEVLAAIRQGLNEAGLSHIGNMGPDTHSHQKWPIPHMLEMGADPDPHIQAYCMHHYHSHFDWDSESNAIGSDPISVTINDQLAKYRAHAHERGKPYLVTELGMFHYGWESGDPAGIARHDNTVLESEFIVRALAGGADCVLRWAWLNPANLDGWWQLIQTVDGSDAPLRDPYYGYGTLMRYLSRGARILRAVITSPVGQPATLHAVAVDNTDGSRTLLVINDDYSNCRSVLVQMPTGKATAVRKIVNDPVRKHYECDPITVSGALEQADVLSPMSLTVYTTRGA
jgi:hypothetical protein